MGEVIQRRYGLPFKGYMSSIPSHLVPDDYLAEGKNLDFVARDGSWKPRRGSATKTSAMLEQAGATIQPRRVFAFQSPSTTATNETFGVLYGGSFGCFAFWSTGTAANATPDARVIGDDYSATQYPANFKVLPLLSNGSYTRLLTAAERASVADGSWNCIPVGEHILFPSYDGTPHIWNKRFNASTSAGSENLRAMPAGAIPPLCPPQINSWSGTTGPFTNGYWFYLSAVYEYEDGSMSQPFIPRPVGAIHANGLGLTQVTGGTDRASLSMRVFRGADGCKKVHVLASPLAASADEAKIVDLQVWFTIDADTVSGVNGKTVVMRDFNLTPDPRVVRFDRIWMPPSRFVWAGDQRVWCGNSSGYRGGIVLAPKLNGTDESPLNTGAQLDSYVINATVAGGSPGIQLRYENAAAADITAEFAFGSETMQDLVDRINNTPVSHPTQTPWMAQLIPGTDPTMPCSYLIYTGTVNFGDGTAGECAAYSNAYPGLAWVNDTYVNQYSATKRRVYFTEGGPGYGGLSPRAWIGGNYREGPDAIGEFVAGGNTPNGQACVHQRGVMVVKNTRDNRTGLDQDYYTHVINERRGCISADSFIQGDGWVAYLTEDGLIACDGVSEIILSEAVYNPATKVGDWSYEIEQCKNSTLATSDRALFRSAVIEGAIYVTFRGSGSQLPDRVMKYDFSGSAAGNGLQELLRADGTPWGWSTQFDYEYSITGIGVGALGVVRGSDGPHIYAASDATDTNGRVEEIETSIYNYDVNATHVIACTTNTNPGTQTYLTTASSFIRVPFYPDIQLSGTFIAVGATASGAQTETLLFMSAAATGAGNTNVTFVGRTVEAYGYTKLQLGDLSRLKSLRRVSFLYSKGATPTYSDGLVGRISRDNNRSTETEVKLPMSDDSSPVTIRTVTPKVRLMAPARVHEFGYYWDGHDLDVVWPPFYGVEAYFEVLDSNR